MRHMITINGKYTEARVFTDELEDLARTQIKDVCHHPAFEGSRVRIMPDVHAGAGCVIGFTAELKTDKVIPNLIGVDIGCGVLTARLNALPDFAEFDARLRERVPSGMHARSSVHQALLDDPELDEEIARICVDVLRTDKDRHRRSIGSLGGGNHFIEIAQGDRDTYLCIHSGSRNFGLKIAEYYQKLATATCPNEYLVQRKKGLCYLEGENTLNYMRDMKVAQRFAALNRRVMLHELMDNAEGLESFDTVHNYIAEDNIIRKGAVQASAGCKLIVPLNMRDGSVICIGKGNEEYNNSSPHGAGRKMSRKKAKSSISLEEFEASMQGIFSTCVSRATLDEAPMAYKDGNSVLDNIHETAEIVERIRPVYNFKSPEW
ncbi:MULTISPECIES: RtcB family protein [unclassified Akkermansia]|uniref:RtcB family protein n=2 Tax=unclassified Akkermansia TaxID=2608915 RepID=UPI00195E7981|nr:MULTISPECIES: RtcB family protein [unclassified Akkermansia]MBS6780964.1 RtcB family protein [Akkermansia sp.]